jgi:hypothetical protein
VLKVMMQPWQQSVKKDAMKGQSRRKLGKIDSSNDMEKI